MIKGPFLVSFGAQHLVRSTQFLPPCTERMEMSITDINKEAAATECTTALSNNVFEPFPFDLNTEKSTFPDEEGRPAPRKVYDLVFRQLRELKVTTKWELKEVARPSTTPSGPAYKDVTVSEVTSRSWATGTFPPLERHAETSTVELLRAPLVGFLTRTDLSSGVRTAYDLAREEVRTPSGAYVGCVRREDSVELKSGTWTTVSYYAPSVGLVRRVQTGPGKEVAYEMLLVGFTKEDGTGQK